MSSSIFGHLEASLHDYLADVATRAQTGDDATAAGLARSELPRIIAALQAVLDEHEPDDEGRCRTCRRRFGRTPAPCRAYLTAHLCLLVDEDDQRPGRAGITAADLRHRLLTRSAAPG
ncbi:MAG TPA: hypothetical protein VGX25_04230 [Actinophytocola sp.]|uniref:hypothetical protein n=1 Tax=Actinophytocola sp. TaxID=1872138 RepID=UPI002DDD42ED|nr:hypothetical protein [Actinophytocola sp.]HEV2778587.1 hypothetical protein [Actinophytocola sp.]